MDILDTAHFKDMLQERRIPLEWVDRAVYDPDQTEDHNDGTRHFLKQIPENGNRWLRVVVNVSEVPKKRITAFFDRRLGREP